MHEPLVPNPSGERSYVYVYVRRPGNTDVPLQENLAPMYELTTNEGRFYVRATKRELDAAERRYIKAKLDSGMSLSLIMFCTGPIHLTPLSIIEARGKSDATNP